MGGLKLSIVVTSAKYMKREANTSIITRIPQLESRFGKIWASSPAYPCSASPFNAHSPYVVSSHLGYNCALLVQSVQVGGAESREGVALNKQSRLELKTKLPQGVLACKADCTSCRIHATCCLKLSENTMSGLCVRWWPPKPHYFGYIYLLMPRRSVPRQRQNAIVAYIDATLPAWIYLVPSVGGNYPTRKATLLCTRTGMPWHFIMSCLMCETPFSIERYVCCVNCWVCRHRLDSAHPPRYVPPFVHSSDFRR